MCARRPPAHQGGLHCGAEDGARLLADAARVLAAAGGGSAAHAARVIHRAARTPGQFGAMVERRAGGLPLEQVVGWAEFRGLRIFVDPGVFVPRRRSEFLVETAISLARQPGPVIVDLCCGTGALGVAIAAGLGGAEPGGAEPGATELGGTELHAADNDPAADC